ncbi:hypothetical protein TWF751_002935 [Orbilia oligospora]|nr:hypothetical protein TWF751_002935 [Orbilia oligospora]
MASLNLLYIPDPYIFDTTRPLAIRLVGEWYNLYIQFTETVGAFVLNYESLNQIQEEGARSFFITIKMLLLQSLRRQKSLGAHPQKLPTDFYLEQSRYLSTWDQGVFGEVGKTISSYINNHNVSYFMETRFPCSIPVSVPPHMIYEKDIVSHAVWMELILAAIQSVEERQMKAVALFPWFIHHSSLALVSFAKSASRPPWNWVVADPSLQRDSAQALLTAEEFSRALIYHAACIGTIIHRLKKNHHLSTANEALAINKKFVSDKYMLTDIPACYALLAQPKLPVAQVESVRRPPTAGLPSDLPYMKPICPCDIHKGRVGSGKTDSPSLWTDSNTELSPLTGLDRVVKMNSNQKYDYLETIEAFHGFTVVQIRVFFAEGLDAFYKGYIWQLDLIEKLVGYPNLQHLTYLHLSGDGYLSIEECNANIGGIVSKLNHLLPSLNSLRNFCWDELSPCHGYGFESLVQPQKSLRTFELLQADCSPEVQGYSKIKTHETNPKGPPNQDDINDRFSSIIEQDALNYFHVHIMYGPRYQCKGIERRERAGFTWVDKAQTLMSIERINWACEWEWRKNIKNPSSENPINFRIQNCEWERDETIVTGQVERYLDLCTRGSVLEAYLAQ